MQFLSPFESGCTIVIYKQQNGEFLVKRGHNNDTVFTNTIMQSADEVTQYWLSLYPNLFTKKLFEAILEDDNGNSNN